MAIQGVFDTVVIKEWKRRRDEYRSRTRWLRVPFYLGVITLVPAYLFLPAKFAPAFITVELINLVLVGCFLSKYSAISLKCPHCGKQPFSPFRRNALEDSCSNCGYWLKEYRESFLNGAPPGKCDQTRE